MNGIRPIYVPRQWTARKIAIEAAWALFDLSALALLMLVGGIWLLIVIELVRAW